LEARVADKHESSRVDSKAQALAAVAGAGPTTPPDPPETPVDFVTPQLTLKSIGTGMVVGGLLSICNIYTGLKIGWGLNMSITGILLAFAFWYALSKITAGKVQNINKLENNVNQSAVSAAGAVSSAGLVSAIPALTMIEGTTWPWWQLFLWISVVCMVGIAVAMGLRRQMIIRDKLPFPGGLSCAATLSEVYNTGSEAIKRVAMLGVGAVLGSLFKILEIVKATSAATFGLKMGPGAVPISTYSFALDPTLVMVAVGGLVGFRACWSLLLGAILSWGIIGPRLVADGITPEARRPIGEWLLWPGVTLMVIASLVSFAYSAPAIIRAFKRTGDAPEAKADTGEVPRKWFFFSLGVALVLAVILQTWFFAITWWAAIIAVLLSFALAVVASRVSGETNVTPVGAMGKVTQLAFAAIERGNPAANLMSASVTAGAASQCADLMHDLKCGYLLGNIARYQVIGQIAGSIVGAAVGSYFYLIMVPDPKTMLGTPEWPAVAVMQWKAVAEVFRNGIDSLPAGAVTAMIIAGIVGIILPTLEKLAPKAKDFIPSAAAVGLGFVISGSNSISMFIGGSIALTLTKLFPKWSERFLVTICAGIIAGESLTGAGDALRLVYSGLANTPTP
jgi:putative OPT family oligopeptide transporter